MTDKALTKEKVDDLFQRRIGEENIMWRCRQVGVTEALNDVRDAVMALELRLANLHVWGAELSLSQLRSEVRDEVSKHFPVFFDEEGGA